jgi:hypothetical protein
MTALSFFRIPSMVSILFNTIIVAPHVMIALKANTRIKFDESYYLTLTFTFAELMEGKVAKHHICFIIAPHT